MLVLSRKLNEKIQIGDDITITILGIKGRGVRVGIEAPREVRVLRSELRRQEDEVGTPPVSDEAPEPQGNASSRSNGRERRRHVGADHRTGFLVAALGRSSSELVDPKKTPPSSRSARRSAQSRRDPGLPR